MDNRLTGIVISENVQIIEDFAFKNNKLTFIELPAGLTAIGYNAFTFNSLQSITIGEKVRIDKNGFDDDFCDFYKKNNRSAGIYLFEEKIGNGKNKGKEWVYKEIPHHSVINQI